GCRRRFGDRLRGHEETIGERLDRDLASVPRLAASALRRLREEGGPGQFAVAGALSRHRLFGADRLWPSRGLIRGYVDAVVISCGAEVIARHARSYEREDFVFDPLHYLALLEHKVGALDQAAPLVGWDACIPSPEVCSPARARAV